MPRREHIQFLVGLLLRLTRKILEQEWCVLDIHFFSNFFNIYLLVYLVSCYLRDYVVIKELKIQYQYTKLNVWLQ